MPTLFISHALSRLTYVLLLSAATAISLHAQTAITLAEAISQAQQANHSVQLANKAVDIQAASLEQSKARFRPYAGLQAANVVTNNPLNVFGAKLLQASVRQEDFNPVLLNDPGSLNNLNVAVNAMMPLYDPEARAQHKAAESQVAMKQAMAKRTQEGIELEVTKAYYMLLLTQRAVEVLQETKAAAEANYAVAENAFNEGLMLKSDLLDMQIMVNQADLALGSAETSFAKAQSQFNLVLNTSTFTEYTPVESLNEADALLLQDGDLNTNRADLQAMKYGIEALQHMSKASDKAFYPKVQAFGSYGINNEVPFEKTADNYQVGVQVRWDLYQGNMRKSSQVKAKAELEEQVISLSKMKAEATMEIENVKLEIMDVKAQLALHERSIEQAEELLRIRRNRFAEGLEKSTDIINSETQLSQRKLARLNSLFELNMKSAYLDLLLK